jgi:hypothetical protein
VGASLGKILSTEYDTLFFRYYAKFASNFDVKGSSHNGAFLQSHYDDPYYGATPGIPANGLNKFLVGYECWRNDDPNPPQQNPGNLNFYVYHPEQRDIWGDHFFPTGVVAPFDQIPGNYGPQFVSRPDKAPSLGDWHCYEFMVKANTAGLRDGRIAVWMDGNLVADFPNLRLRDLNTLKMNKFSIGFHCKTNPAATHKWVDNVVVAKSYIGPLAN